MYRINPLQRNVLITTDEVIFHAPTKHTLDPRTIQNAIIIAEERFIRPALGNAMYDELRSIKNLLVTNDNLAATQAAFGTSTTLKSGNLVNAAEYLTGYNSTLWYDILWKLCAEAVMLTAFPEAYIQFGSAGVAHTVAPASPMGGSGEVGPDLRSVKWMMDKKLMDRIDPLVQALEFYICSYKIQFPKYTKDCPCDDSNSKSRKTNFILGLYDNDENCNCDPLTGWPS
jgi:hypothetical protein